MEACKHGLSVHSRTLGSKAALIINNLGALTALPWHSSSEVIRFQMFREDKFSNELNCFVPRHLSAPGESRFS